MKKNLCYIILVVSTSILFDYCAYGQSTIKSVALKKGEVLDILLLTQNPDVKEDLQSYFQTAFPVAKRMSYQPVPGFKIKAHAQGNHSPANLILGKWNDIEKRETFLEEIINEVPDFHERRRKIWSYFGLSYFEMKEDLSFEIDRSRYNVATAYWLSEGSKSNKFYKGWKQKIDDMDGQVLVQLSDGTSPFGYRYDPDYFVISSWENEAAFNAFNKVTQEMKADGIEHVNEFILE